MTTVAIIDYGVCNLDSVARAVDECGGDAVVTDDPDAIRDAGAIILPGVGSFADGMKGLRERGLDRVIKRRVNENHTPFLGICLGMQLMATQGTEGGQTDGLGIIPGTVERLEPTGNADTIPHVGWNEVHFVTDHPIATGITQGKDFYFVHSYHYRPTRDDHVLARTPYCGGFVSVIQNGHALGVQFHPEKSQKAGFQLLKNFLSLCPTGVVR